MQRPFGVVLDIQHGDCLDLLPALGDEAVDLIYLDPPFNTGRDFGQFYDRWDSMQDYLDFMRDRLAALHRVLKSNGSIYLHCDPNISHHLRLILDDIFGASNFRNEISWTRTSAAKLNAKKFPANTDRILYYAKSGKTKFNAQYRPLSDEYIRKAYRFNDDGGSEQPAELDGQLDMLGGYSSEPLHKQKGRGAYSSRPLHSRDFKNQGAYREGNLSKPRSGKGVYRGNSLGFYGGGGPRSGNTEEYPDGYIYDYKGYKPPANGWRMPIETMRRYDEEGRLIFPKNPDGRIRLKFYLSDSKGIAVSDQWTDIKPKVKGEYPTQKPVELLERIISASSDEGDLVLDPFCGSGTTGVAALKLQRRFIGMDVNAEAVELTRSRCGAA